MKRLAIIALSLAAFLPYADAMTTDEFAETTRKVVSDSGLSGYQPTAVFPARKEFRVLAGAPADITEGKIIAWASKLAIGGEEFLVAFKTDDQHFKVIRCVSGQQTDSKIYAAH
jgi:hypothetical protein